eukprot:CAMPEP_0197254594 /NCGR_PEP_ID=MMETSP1429-20130617/69180_1 /TAXON_ID=49237 /ORGANISM="Chaetoceros  sp., Strain UNC1202" /LENGTH=229 /DNA_ID=CAMNT_0042717631 /DNA_START=43 /DNA_END=729 /DNA_ORIENTATION=-
MTPYLPTPPPPAGEAETTSSTTTKHEKGIYTIPNAKERVRLIIEMAQSLQTHHKGSATLFLSGANRSADRLVHMILAHFPGFRDTAIHPYTGTWIAFYKRAQILVADLWAALGGDGDGAVSMPVVEAHGLDLCKFVDMDRITTFADYRVPQLLRNLGVLEYGKDLAERVDSGKEIQIFSLEELYIRASTVVAVDELVVDVKKKVVMEEEKNTINKKSKDTNINAVKMDW